MKQEFVLAVQKVKGVRDAVGALQGQGTVLENFLRDLQRNVAEGDWSSAEQTMRSIRQQMVDIATDVTAVVDQVLEG